MNKTETTLLKGVGILLIIGHNFQYLVSALPGVNEFVFDRENVAAFLNAPGPLSVLAYLGHYGVQIFIFLSAYGLTLRHPLPAQRGEGRGEGQSGYTPFIRTRLARLYPSFLLAILAWALWKGLPHGPLGPIDQLRTHFPSILWKLSLVSNLVRGEQLSLVGPWWFLPFIFQFYLLFPLLQRLPPRGLLAVSLASLLITIALNETLLPGGFLYATPLGHLPEFCVGIAWARTPNARISLPLALTALLVFIMGNFVEAAWYLSHLSVLVLFLATWPVLRRALLPMKRPLLFIGGISMQLFLVNGFLRDPFMTWAKQSGTGLAALGWGLASFATCVAFAWVLWWLESRLPTSTKQHAE